MREVARVGNGRDRHGGSAIWYEVRCTSLFHNKDDGFKVAALCYCVMHNSQRVVMRGDSRVCAFRRREIGDDRTNVGKKRFGVSIVRENHPDACGDSVVDGQYVRSCMLLLLKEKNTKRGFP